jgi:hypothetical protein
MTKMNMKVMHEIGNAISISSKSLAQHCKENTHWPNARNIRKAIREHEEYRHIYATAKDEQMDYLAEQMLEICDNDSKDLITKVDSEGNEYQCIDMQHINRARLRIDTRKFICAKLKPKVYGTIINKNDEADQESLIEKVIDKL